MGLPLLTTLTTTCSAIITFLVIIPLVQGFWYPFVEEREGKLGDDLINENLDLAICYNEPVLLDLCKWYLLSKVSRPLALSLFLLC